MDEKFTVIQSQHCNFAIAFLCVKCQFEGICAYFFLSAQYASRITVYSGGLRFNKVTRADTGDYDCEVSGNDGYGENTVKLTVLGNLYCVYIITT